MYRHIHGKNTSTGGEWNTSFELACVCKYTYIHKFMCIYISHIGIYMEGYVDWWRVAKDSLRMSMRVCIHIDTYMYIHTYVRMSMCVCMYAGMNMCVSIYKC